MGAAVVARDFGTGHAVATVEVFVNQLGGVGRMKARPAATGVEFGGRFKQWCITTDAAVGACFLAIPVDAGEGRFGAFFPGHPVLGWR